MPHTCKVEIRYKQKERREGTQSTDLRIWAIQQRADKIYLGEIENRQK